MIGKSNIGEQIYFFESVLEKEGYLKSKYFTNLITIMYKEWG